MVLKISKKNIIFLGLGIALMSGDTVLALTQEELNNYILEGQAERYVSSKMLEDFLKKNGVSIKEYKTYIEELNKYSESTEFLWERLENGSIIMDEILFSDNDIKKEYEKALEALGTENMAYNYIKKNMINNPKMFISKFETNFQDMDKVCEAFKKKFNRDLNDLEKAVLEDGGTAKELLYIGANNGYLTEQQIFYVEDGIGYKVLGLTDEDLKTYMTFIKKRDKYDELAIKYLKSYAMYQSIALEINDKYKVDIYKDLTDSERMSIYNKSVDGFIFNEKKAKEKVLDLLVSKKILTKEDLEEKEESNKNKEEKNTSNPWEELKKHLKDKKKNDNQSITSLYATQGISSVYENLSEYSIGVKYKNEDIDTEIRLPQDDMLSKSVLGKLFSVLEERIDLKSIFGKEDVLTLLDNEISVLNLSFDEAKGMAFKDAVEVFKDMGINMYLKKVDYSEEIYEEQDNSGADKMVLNFKDKMIEYDLSGSEDIKIENVKEILNILDAKVIVSLDSVIVLKDNEIKISKTFGINDDTISISKLKRLFEDIGEKVSIKVIKEGM